jgi:hypothetical protein
MHSFPVTTNALVARYLPCLENYQVAENSTYSKNINSFGIKEVPVDALRFFRFSTLGTGNSTGPKSPFRYPGQIDNFCRPDDNCRRWQAINKIALLGIASAHCLI